MYVYVCMYVSMYACMHACMYACVCVCVCVQSTIVVTVMFVLRLYFRFNEFAGIMNSLVMSAFSPSEIYARHFLLVSVSCLNSKFKYIKYLPQPLFIIILFFYFINRNNSPVT